ncbi:leucine-rich repeat-containing protein 19-like [Silurus meridionalis]|uniref:leucine-rich repeat-containing protein 19-like n=1 Tax=Silurus meridionalis TaxID=175797 RepID=UPI001EEB12D0|nr:leucine-rich repeat-containing protein 19-like [Silurus meridionalis]
MIMTLKQMVLLWTVSLFTDAAGIQVNNSYKALRNIPNNYNVNTTGLILHHNQIMMDTMDIQALKNYSKLTHLDLSYNRIAKLPDGVFSALGSLENLSLSGNKLRTIKNETFADLKKLKTLDLDDNPWNCTWDLVEIVKWMNNMGLQTGSNATCSSPVILAGQRILDVLRISKTPLPSVKSNTAATTKSVSTFTVTASTKTIITVRSPSRPSQEMTTVSSQNVSGKDTMIKAEQNNKPEGTNTWMFLSGVIVIILCTSMVIVCAVKSPIWYKMLFDYRHQRLREAEEPSIFSTSRFSNFSLDTEQTETSAQELDQGLAEDEDGFIEDGYIQPEDYKENVDIDEV